MVMGPPLNPEQKNHFISVLRAPPPIMSLRVPSRSRSRSTLRQPSRERPAKLMKSHPSSRGTSPARLTRRPSKIDLYLQKSSRRNSIVNLAHEMEHVPSGMHAREIKRWDGIQRMTVRWDSLRKVRSSITLHSSALNYKKGPRALAS